MYIPYLSIENDNQAEDLISQIKQAEAERDRLMSVCDYEINKYQNLKEGYRQGHENNIADALALLGEYCRQKANHNTKTLDSYKLPSGKLQWTRKQPKVIRDDKALLEWLETNLPVYVKTERKPDWEMLKKNAQVIGNNYMTQEGEIIEGVYLEEQPETFNVLY